jgi:hypothetical protein
MVSDARIEQAIAIGRKNKLTMELVRNWCAHVSVRKYGGVGLIEAQTGLPIGHHFLECPHAPAGGMAAWDLAETAIDFYDRNCVDCKFRQPVRLPNITTLVAARDAEREKQRIARNADEQEVASRLTAREAQRQQLRTSLDTLAVTTLDLISELDRERKEDAAHRLVHTAELAPETFPPAIVDHLFALVDSKEYWLVEPSLRALTKLPVDQARLCNAALRTLRNYSARDTSAEIVAKHAEHADEQWILGALPALVGLANPTHSSFGPSRPVPPNTAPLFALYRSHKDAVRAGLKALLEEKDAFRVRKAALGVEVLAHQDASILRFLATELVAKVARSKWLVQGREEEVTDALNDIRDALRLVFEARPKETDALIADYMVGASPENVAELYHVYDAVLRDIRFNRNREEEPEITDAHRLAFRRLVVATTESTHKEVFDAAGRLFYGEPYELTVLASEEVDLLLGSAALLDGKLDEPENFGPELNRDPLYALQRENRRSGISNRAHSFVRWACIGARRKGPDAVNKILTFLRGLPESSERLRSMIIGNFHVLMGTPDTLTLCLPDYYSALVGSSQRCRSSAATALGELRPAIRDSLPTLVFEAFVALLSDPYIIVHQAAVRALERFELDPEFEAVAQQALSNIILAYARSRDSDEFLMTVINLLSYRYATPEKLSGGLGSALIDIMKATTPYAVAREMCRSAGRRFSGNPNYPSLLFGLLEDEQAMSLCHEELFDLVARLPASAVYPERANILAVGKSIMSKHPESVAIFIEALTGAGAWREAEELASAAVDAIEDTTRNKPRRLDANLEKIACSYEAAIASGQPEELDRLRDEWNSTLNAIEADRAEHKDRRDPLRGLFGAH